MSEKEISLREAEKYRLWTFEESYLFIYIISSHTATKYIVLLAMLRRTWYRASFSNHRRNSTKANNTNRRHDHNISVDAILYTYKQTLTIQCCL
jgi:hypothetical protein